MIRRAHIVSAETHSKYVHVRRTQMNSWNVNVI